MNVDEGKEKGLVLCDVCVYHATTIFQCTKNVVVNHVKSQFHSNCVIHHTNYVYV